MSGFAPPLPAPSASFPVIHTPRTDQQRRQCEGVGGQYQEHCQQPGQMMPGFTYGTGLPPGTPPQLMTPPCVSYCTLPSGDQATYDSRTGSWSPPLTALDSPSSQRSYTDPELVASMMGGEELSGSSVFWKIAKSAAAFVVAYKIAESMEKPAKTRRVVAWAAAGAAFLFL